MGQPYLYDPATTESPMRKIARAQMFAAGAHYAVKQLRKYTDEPYIVHPTDVANIVESVRDSTPDMVCAAYLHDVVEDTGVEIETIRELFGDNVGNLVSDLTDVSKKVDGSRAVRKEMDRQHTAQASPEAKTVKLADLISNSKTIFDCDPEFAEIYLKEKKLLLEVLTEGDAGLYQQALDIIGTAQVRIETARLQRALGKMDQRTS